MEAKRTGRCSFDSGPGQILHYDLDRHREKITRLYVDEKRTLKDVRAILFREDSCNASANMYLRKIRAWKINRNADYEQMVEFLKAIKTRKANGHPPISRRINNRDYSERQAFLYFNRKFRYASLDEAIEGQLGPTNTETSFDMKHNTPRVGDLQVFLDGAHQPLGLSISMNLALPEDLNIQSQYVWLTSLHQEEILMPFVLQKQKLSLSMSNELAKKKRVPSVFFDTFQYGLDLLSSSDLQTAFATLERAFSMMHVELENRSFATLSNFQTMIDATVRLNQPALRKMLVEHMFLSSRIQNGPHHLFTRWSEILIKASESAEMINLGFQVMVDATRDVLGREAVWTCRLMNVVLAQKSHMPNQPFQQMNMEFLNMINWYRTFPNIISTAYFLPLVSCQRIYAQWLNENDLTIEAVAILAEYLPLLEEKHSEDITTTIIVVVKELFTYTCRLGLIEEARTMIEKGVKKGREELGIENGPTSILMFELVKFRQEYGESAEPDAVADELARLMEPFKLSK